jgi:hypothetical protein
VRADARMEKDPVKHDWDRHVRGWGTCYEDCVEALPWKGGDVTT